MGAHVGRIGIGLREVLLRRAGGAALRAMTEEEAQALLGWASKAGNVEGMERAAAAGADVRAAVYHENGSMGGTCTAAFVAACHNNNAVQRQQGRARAIAVGYC